LYDFIWDNLCDWYIELVKPRLFDTENVEAHKICENVIAYVLSNTLKLLHPFMPFITEEIWQTLPHEGESIMVATWPKQDASLSFPEDAASMEQIMDAIRAIRNRRAEMNVPPSKKAQLFVVAESDATHATFESGKVFLTKLAYASEVEVLAAAPADAASMVSAVTNAVSLYIPMNELVDREKELERLNKEREKAMKEYTMFTNKLNNPSFVDRAPANVVAAEREKLARVESLLAKIDESIARL
ncbi:MAG: class I tRNA ligase family protein, partial [Clostridia bacterium]|nr:class I tRNA ligase family protein [Clostridia bacterium]